MDSQTVPVITEQLKLVDTNPVQGQSLKVMKEPALHGLEA